jgi:hypothetical protein
MLHTITGKILKISYFWLPENLGCYSVGDFADRSMVKVRNTPVRLEVGWWGRAFCLHGFSLGRGGFHLRWGIE